MGVGRIAMWLGRRLMSSLFRREPTDGTAFPQFAAVLKVVTLHPFIADRPSYSVPPTTTQSTQTDTQTQTDTDRHTDRHRQTDRQTDR